MSPTSGNKPTPPPSNNKSNKPPTQTSGRHLKASASPGPIPGTRNAARLPSTTSTSATSRTPRKIPRLIPPKKSGGKTPSALSIWWNSPAPPVTKKQQHIRTGIAAVSLGAIAITGAMTSVQAMPFTPRSTQEKCQDNLIEWQDYREDLDETLSSTRATLATLAVKHTDQEDVLFGFLDDPGHGHSFVTGNDALVAAEQETAQLAPPTCNGNPRTDLITSEKALSEIINIVKYSDLSVDTFAHNAQVLERRRVCESAQQATSGIRDAANSARDTASHITDQLNEAIDLFDQVRQLDKKPVDGVPAATTISNAVYNRATSDRSQITSAINTQLTVLDSVNTDTDCSSVDAARASQEYVASTQSTIDNAAGHINGYAEEATKMVDYAKTTLAQAERNHAARQQQAIANAEREKNNAERLERQRQREQLLKDLAALSTNDDEVPATGQSTTTPQPPPLVLPR